MVEEAEIVVTPVRDLSVGSQYRLKQKHGPNTRVLVGTLEAFDDAEGERRYQIVGEQTIGFTPDQILEVEKIY